LVAAVLIYGYWSYQTIQVQKIAIDEMSQVLSGQCKIMLEQQGFSVVEGVKDAKVEEDSK
jgi:hypothetical protein